MGTKPMVVSITPPSESFKIIQKSAPMGDGERAIVVCAS